MSDRISNQLSCCRWSLGQFLTRALAVPLREGNVHLRLHIVFCSKITKQKYAMPTEERQLAAIMFTDMVGYSALSQKDEALALELLEEHRQIVREILARFHGTEIKTIGDAFLLEFRSALEAVQCAIEIQRTFAKRNHDVPHERQIELRIGIHLGDVVRRDGDVYGDGVNIASRIEPLAIPGGICISEDVERQVRSGVGVRVEKLAPAELKNIQLPMGLYRLVLEWEKSSTVAALPKSGKRAPMTKIAIAVLMLVALLAGASVWWLRRHHTEASAPAAVATDNKSIAVLPFENASGNADPEYLSDGISEALINSLSELQQLQVTARSTAFRYKGKQIDPQAVGRELKVQTVLMGVVRQMGDRLNVQVDLVDATTGAQLWGQEYERKLMDVVAVKQTLVREVTEKLRLKLTGEQQQRLTQRDPANPESYQFYLRGRYYWNKRTAREPPKKRWSSSNRQPTKTRITPPQHAGLADCYLLLEDYAGIPASETFPKAKAFAQRALQLDSLLAEAHTSLAYVYTNLWEWEQAEEEFKHSLKLNPNYATAPHWYSVCLLSLGRTDEAMAEIKRAHELDPLSVVIGTTLTYAYMAQGDVNSYPLCKSHRPRSELCEGT